MNDYILEVCVDSAESALAAAKGGASRLELCQNLVIGGTTPSPKLFEVIRRQTTIPIHALIRPRFGDFCYTPYELEEICEEVAMYRELGAEGVVIGVLKEDGTMNMTAMEQLMEAANGMSVTLHRAFDVCRDPKEALEQAVSLGMNTILTSGQQNSAVKGAELLAELQRQAAGRIRDQSHIQCFLGRILAAEEPEFTGFLLAYDTSQIRRTKSGIEAAHARPCLTEDGVFRRNGQVADYVKHMSATDGISVDHGNHRFRDGTNLFLYVEHIQTGNAVSTYVSAVAFHVHVASGAESLVASSCQYDDIDVLTLTAVIQCVTDFSSGGWSERIAVSRAVDGNLGDSIIKLKKNILVFLDGFPFSGL